MKKLLLFLCGKYRKSITIQHKKEIQKYYVKLGFTNTGYTIYKQLK